MTLVLTRAARRAQCDLICESLVIAGTVTIDMISEQKKFVCRRSNSEAKHETSDRNQSTECAPQHVQFALAMRKTS